MDNAAVDDRLAFAPPRQDGLWRGFVLAILAHLLLLLALTHGLQWQRESENVAVEAELWARTPQQAAPQEAVPPPPPPAPVVRAPPQPEPPVVKAPPQPEPPVNRDADIAQEREKEKRELEKRRQAELEQERAEQRRAEAQKKKREEELARRKDREEELARQKQEQAKLAEAKRKDDEKKRREQEVREARETARVARLREENLDRMRGMAGSGAPSSTGTAAQSSGPSASWGARVQARVRPNIVFTEAVSGNPKAEVEVRLAPDGTIVGKRLVRSSGVKSWDEAVLRALDKTESLPRDVDGRVPTPVVIEFRPKG